MQRLSLLLITGSLGIQVGQLEASSCGDLAHTLLTHSSRTHENSKIPLLKIGDQASLEDIRRAESFLESLRKAPEISRPPESEAIQRYGIPLQAATERYAVLRSTHELVIKIPDNQGMTLDGIRYIEFPNSTMVQTTDSSSGKSRSFLLARGVRPYETRVDLRTGKIEPQGYVSDVLVYEMLDGKAVYRQRLLTSKPEINYFFEDPRISVLYDDDGSQRILLSGTDFSPHIPGSNNPDAMNRFIEIQVDNSGNLIPPPLDEQGRPFFKNLGPAPMKKADGSGYIPIDAKNAVIFQHNDKIYVSTRLRPDFGHPEIEAIADGNKWTYAEQVFVFSSLDDFKNYNWDYALNDLFQKNVGQGDRVRPEIAKILWQDSDLKELYRDPRVLLKAGKGGGPGTPPIKVTRRGNKIFASRGDNAPEILLGELDHDLQILKDGEDVFINFGHEIRKIDENGFQKRDYSLSVRLGYSPESLDAYYADAIQPRIPKELGEDSGIADLWHVYPMGLDLNAGVGDRPGQLIISGGISDAHTELYSVDMLKLLREFERDSAASRRGQIYRPRP